MHQKFSNKKLILASFGFSILFTYLIFIPEFMKAAAITFYQIILPLATCFIFPEIKKLCENKKWNDKNWNNNLKKLEKLTFSILCYYLFFATSFFVIFRYSLEKTFLIPSLLFLNEKFIKYKINYNLYEILITPFIFFIISFLHSFIFFKIVSQKYKKTILQNTLDGAPKAGIDCPSSFLL